MYVATLFNEYKFFVSHQILFLGNYTIKMWYSSVSAFYQSFCSFSFLSFSFVIHFSSHVRNKIIPSHHTKKKKNYIKVKLHQTIGKENLNILFLWYLECNCIHVRYWITKESCCFFFSSSLIKETLHFT